MKRAEKSVADAKRRFEQMRAELHNLKPEDRADWLPFANEHEQALSDLIAEAGYVNELVAAGNATASEVPTEDDDEPVTREGSEADDSFPPSNEHTAATEIHEFDSSVAFISETLDKVDAALEEGTVDHSTEEHLEQAEREYNYMKVGSLLEPVQTGRGLRLTLGTCGRVWTRMESREGNRAAATRRRQGRIHA